MFRAVLPHVRSMASLAITLRLTVTRVSTFRTLFHDQHCSTKTETVQYVTVCVKSGLGVRQPDRGAKIRGGCSLTPDTARMDAGTRPPVHGPRSGARGPRPGMRGQLGMHHASRPTAHGQLGVCDPSSQTESQTQTRASWALQLGESIPASWARPTAHEAASWAHGARAGAVRSGIRDQGPRGPDPLRGAPGVRGQLAEAFHSGGIMYGAGRARFIGAKKNRPEGRSARPSWAELRENESRYEVQ